MKQKRKKLNLPPFLKKLKEENPKEFKKAIKNLKLGLDLKSWELLKQDYGL